MGSRIATKRLTKELVELRANCPAGCEVLQADDLESWIIKLSVGDCLYAGEEFALRFRFSSSYPIDSPEVTFLVTPPSAGGWKAPVHPHIYSNGHICASILGSGWSPVLNVSAICLTLQSMLASNTERTLPPDNDRYVKSAPSNPKLTRWAYHDDTV